MHNTGRGAKYTRGRCPSSVLHSWIVPDKRAAILEERAFKALSRRGKMDFLSRQRSAVDVAEPLRGCTDAATREG
jgi:predicted GIY-YIG superfamily endonuclease